MKDNQLFNVCVTIMDTATGLMFHRIAIVFLPLLLVSGEYTLYILGAEGGGLDYEWASLTCKELLTLRGRRMYQLKNCSGGKLS